MSKKLGKYDLFEFIGEGALGKVRLAKNTETSETVAIKVIEKEKIKKQNLVDQIKKEIAIMKSCKHRNIVTLKEVLASNSRIFIVLEYLPHGDLFDYISKNRRLSEEQSRLFTHQLVEGMEYLHRLGVCHRDLKPENLLLDENMNIKITDFGLSAVVKEGNGEILLHTTCGSPNYVAPEVLREGGYIGFKADIWSIGVIMYIIQWSCQEECSYVMIVGILPFDEDSLSVLFRKIQHADFNIPEYVSSEACDLIRHILDPNPNTRYTLQQIKQHPWYKNVPSTTDNLQSVSALGDDLYGDIYSPIDIAEEQQHYLKIAYEIDKKNEGNEHINNAVHIKKNEKKSDRGTVLITSSKNKTEEMNSITIFELINILNKLSLEYLTQEHVEKRPKSSSTHDLSVVIAKNGLPLLSTYLYLCAKPLPVLGEMLRELVQYAKTLVPEILVTYLDRYIVNLGDENKLLSIQLQLLQFGHEIYILSICRIDGETRDFYEYVSNIHDYIVSHYEYAKLMDNQEKASF